MPIVSLSSAEQRRPFDASLRSTDLGGFRGNIKNEETVSLGIIPIDLLAKERKQLFDGSRGNASESREAATRRRKEIRQKLMRFWQRRWDEECKGRWTYRINLLKDHGCFGKYLHRIKKGAETKCYHCEAEVDDAEHTLFGCPAWAEERKRMEEIGVTSPENLGKKLIEKMEAWVIIDRHVRVNGDAQEGGARTREKNACEMNGRKKEGTTRNKE
ncbi:uncharacterized protein LOC143910839 [Arctopsyche grandis]|uniref:uncharacterized protein LOC143910839 n=1 Tax=Arctopsyche grandis TaxID=121162 RepID=UPI00406D6CA2